MSRLVRIALALAFLLSASARLAAARPPNVVVILVDDLGWADLAVYGSRFHRTPNLDRLAAEGTRFTHAYSACTVCSPTRAALLTGKYPARLHLTDWIPGDNPRDRRLRGPDWTQRLDPSEPTLARVLKSAGYATATIGKWHLGGTNSTPADFGFDVNRGGDHRGQPPRYVAPYGIPSMPEGAPGEFLTDRESMEAVAFIEANRARPFFLYLPHYAVHQPIAGKPDVVARYRAAADPRAPQHNADYAALLESVDDSVGRIVGRLRDLGLEKDTMVVFTSDNGGLAKGGDKAPTSNAPLRSGKGDVYEGGVRVPLIVRWPGTVKAGLVSSVPVHSIDLYPTVLEATGARDVAGHVRDGTSWLRVARGRGSLAARPLFWHFPHYHSGGATPYGAVREGPWKLVEFYEDGRHELYNLETDPSEKSDLSAANAPRVRAMSAELAAWRERIGAQMPVPNPDHR